MIEQEQANDNTTGEAANEVNSRRSRKSSGKKKRGARSSSARRQRSIDVNSEGDGEGENDLKPDFEAEEVTKKTRLGESPNRINKEDLFKPVKEVER